MRLATRRRIAALVAVPLAGGLALVAGCGGGDGGASTAASTVRAAAGPTTCPTQASTPFYVYVKNTSSNPVKLRPGYVDCADWSGAANPSAMGIDVAAGARAPYVTLRPVTTTTPTPFLWSVQLFTGDLPDGVLAMQLDTNPSNPPGRFKAVTATLFLSVDGGAYGPVATTGSGMKFTVVPDTCLTTRCFTIRIS